VPKKQQAHPLEIGFSTSNKVAPSGQADVEMQVLEKEGEKTGLIEAATK